MDRIYDSLNVNPETGSEFYVNLSETQLGDLSFKDDEEKSRVKIVSDVVRKPAEKNCNPTLYIGLGGTGIKVVDHLKLTMIENSDSGVVRNGVAFLGFDCNRDEVMQCETLQANSEVFAVTLSDPKQFKEENSKYCKWVTQKIFPPNAEFGAGQYRQVSRMCFLHHYNTIEDNLYQAIIPILPAAEEGFKVKLDVYIVCSLCGGAGSGMYSDFAVLLHEFQKNNAVKLSIFGFFVSGDVYTKFSYIKPREHPRLLANTYSCLKELQYLQNIKSEHNKSGGKPLQFQYPDKNLSLTNPPFDLVFVIQSTNRHSKPTLISMDQLKHYLSSVIYLMSSTPLGKDNQAKWVNPESGYNDTFEWVDNAPKAFSSLGYLKFMYPEKEFINYLNGYYGEKILSYFLDAIKFINIPDDQKDDPTRISIKDHIAKIASAHVDNSFEVEDLRTVFDEGLQNFRFDKDEIYQAISDLLDSEDWENIPESINKYENSLDESLSQKRIDIENSHKRVAFGFDKFLNDLPYTLLDKGIGIRHLNQYLSSLVEELDEEEATTIRILEKLSGLKETNKEEWIEQKEEIQCLINDKPFFRARNKLDLILETYCNELSEYLNIRLNEEVLKHIILTYRSMDGIINERLRIAKKVINKFDAALKLYRDHTRKFQRYLNTIAGKKKAYSYHMEFSILDTDQLNSMALEFINSNPPNKQMMSLFGRHEKDSSQDFWQYRDPRIEPKHIINYIQNSIETMFDKFRMSLNDVAASLNIKKKNILEKLEEHIGALSAQWTVKDIKAGVQPIVSVTEAYPKDFILRPGTKNADSTSNRLVEALKIEYAMPSQLFSNISSLKRNFNRIDKEVPQSLHIFPAAYGWPEADVFPAKEDMLQYFSVGLALGYIYEPTQKEREMLDFKYGKKGYRCLIFKSGIWYILMPHYSLPPRPAEMADKPIMLGQGRGAAYREFMSDPHNIEIIKEWIEDRIMGKDVGTIITKLQEYSDFVLSKEKPEDGSFQIEKEKAIIEDYIKMVKQTKSFFI